MIRLRNVSKAFGTNRVLRDISFDVERGEVVCLIGPSGSGKSTVLRCINGLETHDSGEITVSGTAVSKATLATVRAKLAMVFQRFNLFPHRTVLENVAEGPIHAQGRPIAEVMAEARVLLDKVGIGEKADAHPGQLSGGQQQRVALARALVFQPPVLLMDEPLGALDKKMREHLQVEIKDIQRITGTTVIFVTHDQSEALGMADRLVVLNHGHIEQVGTPEELYTTPANAFVADFIGEANILKGTLAGLQGDRCTVRLANGDTIEGTPIGAFRDETGAPVDLVVRPGGIRLDGVAQAGLPAQVLSTSYFGESVSVRVRLASGEVLTVKEPASSRRAAGENLSVSWPHQNARVFQPNS